VILLMAVCVRMCVYVCGAVDDSVCACVYMCV